MSPALTRGHSQDVVNADEDRCQSDLDNTTASIKNTLSKPFLFPGSREEECGSSVRPCNGTKTVGLSLHAKKSVIGVNHAGVSPSNNSNNNSSDESSIKHINANMTPRILLPHIKTTAGFKPVNGTRVMESNGSSLCKQSVVGASPSESPSEGSSAKTVANTVALPSIDDINKRYESMEHEINNALKRINRLQGIVATRHSRQQIKRFVQNYPLAAQKQVESKASVVSVTSDNSKTCTSAANTPVAISESKMETIADQLSDFTKPRLNGLVQESNEQNLGSLSTDPPDREIFKNVGIMAAALRQLRADGDSEATDSSSGDDSETEDIVLSPPGVSSENIKKKPCWRWGRDRAMVISRWTWLQAQVSDLEYKIRQHGELHKQLRSSKVSLYSEQTRTQLASEHSSQSAARCIPLSTSSTPRHKLVRISQAYALGRKARQHPNIKCQCAQTMRRCVICAGHHHYSKPVDIETVQRKERISNLDPSFHPVLSFPQEVNPAIELEDVVNSSDRKLKATVDPDTALFRDSKKELTDSIKKQKLALKLKKSKDKQLKKAKKQKEASDMYFMRKNKKKKSGKLGKRVSVRCNSHAPKWEEDDDENLEEEEAEQSLSQSVPAGAELSRSSTAGTYKRMNAYDIDDIVIPYHLAASTRVEKLQYKEIDTPRWREKLVNGTTVHQEIQRRSSSTSVSMTPVTPSSMDISLPLLETLTVDTTEPSASEPAVLTPVSSACSLPCSDNSSTPSLVNLEVDEDISDSKYMTMHSLMEEKEKSRYMNFVSSTRRVRTQSVTSSGARHSVSANPLSPGSQADECIEVSTSNDASSSSRSNQVSPTPLTLSHDATLMREELSVATRKRCSSLTGNRPRKEQSQDAPEKTVSPWPRRNFPLDDDDELGGMTLSRSTSRRSSFHSSSNRRWKVISTEEDQPGHQKHALVLKLSKS